MRGTFIMRLCMLGSSTQGSQTMQKYKNIDMTITTTAHARQRIAQRGVCQKALALLSLNGMDSPAGAGRVRRELRYSQMAELHEQGYSLEVIDKALRLEAIFSN